MGDLQEAQQALAGEGGGLEGRLNAALRGLEREMAPVALVAKKGCQMRCWTGFC